MTSGCGGPSRTNLPEMTTLPASAIAILARSDAGEYPDAIAEAESVSTGYVYQVLREHRPNRARKPHPKKSALRLRILLAKAEGKAAGDIARELAGKCSRAYVYATLKETTEAGR